MLAVMPVKSGLRSYGGLLSILDDSLGIDWKIKDKASLSEKDTKHPLLKDFDSPFDIKIYFPE